MEFAGDTHAFAIYPNQSLKVNTERRLPNLANVAVPQQMRGFTSNGRCRFAKERLRRIGGQRRL
jgi:hypothetical protein